MIEAITGLLVCQLVGELLARGLHLPVPGPVLGMVVLFCALLLRDGRKGRAEGDAPAPLAAVGDTLLSNLGLLFVPAGVGVVIYGPLLARDWVPISMAVVVGTLLGIGFTGRLAQALLRRMR